MNKNIGITDKIIRIFLSVIIAVLFLTNVISGILGLVLLLFAAILLLTAFFSFCPTYRLIGIKSCSDDEEDDYTE